MSEQPQQQPQQQPPNQTQLRAMNIVMGCLCLVFFVNGLDVFLTHEAPGVFRLILASVQTLFGGIGAALYVWLLFLSKRT